MKTPVWTKPALFGAAIGAVATVILGFGWGGWVTGAKAGVMAGDEAKAAVVSALVPICLELSRRDPTSAATLNKLKDANRYQRSDLLIEAGWATMPGSDDPVRSVANACVDELAAQF